VNDILGNWKRSHFCGELRAGDIGKEVCMMGWVQRRRDHGGLIFIDLRDREGIVQLALDPDRDPEAHAKADRVRNEWVIAAIGKVSPRPDGTVNPKMPTGEVEVEVSELRLLNQAETPPFMLDEYTDVAENIRLKHRYLDLRRPAVQKNLILRHKVSRATRTYLDAKGFLEIETPVLTKSTPEGARDYLVPSRVNPGQFYALPQSPQIFKQLLMVAGYDRYAQITRCFRDEDLRADRQPEFTQLDIETSFLDQEAIMTLVERLLRKVFQDVLDVALPEPFPRMTYAEAMTRFGVDRPDLRIPLELTEISDLLANVEFKVFSGPANDPGGRVAALRVPGAGPARARARIPWNRSE